MGHSTSSGQLGWRHSGNKTIKIRSGNYRQWATKIGNNSFKNIVIHFNTTWDTSSLAGCGLIFRSERDLLNRQQYIFDTIRFSGYPGWRVRLFEYIDFQANITGGTRFTDKLDLDNLAKNNFVLVADGTTLIMYINGSRASSVTVFTRSEGRFAFYAWQQDGSTTCTFEDAWIWELP